jgi:hypothetical protein
MVTAPSTDTSAVVFSVTKRPQAARSKPSTVASRATFPARCVSLTWVEMMRTATSCRPVPAMIGTRLALC